MVDIMLLITGGVTLVGGVAWSVRQEGRINTLEAIQKTSERASEAQKEAIKEDLDRRFEDLKELISEKFEAQGKRLERVERAMNGHLRN